MAFLENTGLERVWGHIVHRLSLKVDKSDVVTGDEIIDFIGEMGYANPLMTNNTIYTNDNNQIYVL